MIAVCLIYTVGAWLRLKPLKIGNFRLVYPRMPIVARQFVAAPLELMSAAGIIYFALPSEGNPGPHIVLGAFLRRFRNIRIPEGERHSFHTGSVFGVDRLPLEWELCDPGAD